MYKFKQVFVVICLYFDTEMYDFMNGHGQDIFYFSFNETRHQNSWMDRRRL